jgi:nucleotide-binding universal stress UspA family protein
MMKILVCTDGSGAAERAALFLTKLSLPPDTGYTVLGVSEADGDQDQLNGSFERIEKLFSGTASQVARKIRRGNPAEQIKIESEETVYDLIALSASGKAWGISVFHIGTTAHKLARLLATPLLVARAVPDSVRRVLLCTGGETSSLENIKHAGKFLANVQLEIRLLHVMSQVALRLDSPAQDLVDTAETAIERHTREGRHLDEAVHLLREAGVSGPIHPGLRHGLVVEEVLAELNEGTYELLVVGGHHHREKSLWLERLLEDISGELADHAPCSVLIV